MNPKLNAQFEYRTIDNTLVIYHGNCADGFTAAWAFQEGLKYNYGSQLEESQFYPGIYQKAPPDCEGKDVFLLDFSYKVPVLLDIASVARSVTIIDHHKSAIQDIEKALLPANCYCYFDMEESGASLVWKLMMEDVPMPDLVKVVKDRDLWQFKIHGSHAASERIFSYAYTLQNWDILAKKSMQELIMEGTPIYEYKMKSIKEYIQVCKGKSAVIDGYQVPCINVPYMWASETGHVVLEMFPTAPFVATYYAKKDSYVFSLRSANDRKDVAEIAVKLGGGGHRNAAGFEIAFDQLSSLTVTL